MIGLYFAFPASAVSSCSLLLHNRLIYLQLGSFQLLQIKIGKNSSHVQWFSSIEPAKEIHLADHDHSVNQPWASSRNERVHHNENQLAHMETI